MEKGHATISQNDFSNVFFSCNPRHIFIKKEKKGELFIFK